jgi:hypothetical protein
MMFEPRPPLAHKPPIIKRKMPPYTGIGAYLQEFEVTPPPPKPYFETPQERLQRMKEERQKSNDEKNELLAGPWDPSRNFKATPLVPTIHYTIN